jgi:hypothetical protein
VQSPSRVTNKTQLVATTIRRLLRERGSGKTICPSEVARAIDPEQFRPWLPIVRGVASRLIAAHEIIALQTGKVVDLETARGPIRLASASHRKTSYANGYRGVDFRAQPDRYRVGRGEEGVLIAEPYKSELLPLWKFRTPALARESATLLWHSFTRYRKARDFVGMDMARKYLQMGFTRARRYANHRSGRKYAQRDVGMPRSARQTLPFEPDAQKAEAAAIFYEMFQRAERDRVYASWRKRQKVLEGSPPDKKTRKHG